MVSNNSWLSMRHFVTQEYLNDIFMGQQQCEICNTDIKTNGLLDNLSKCTIFASTLMRSRQTVDYVVSNYQNVDFTVIFSDNLIERNLGIFECKNKASIRTNLTYFDDGKFIVEKTPPGGESINDFRSRVNKEVQIIKKEFSNNNILVISHLHVLRMIFLCMHDIFVYDQWHKLNYIHGEIVEEKYGKKAK